MITISTRIPDQANVKSLPEEEIILPEFDEPCDGIIKSLLNFSKSLEVTKSGILDRIEIVKT